MMSKERQNDKAGQSKASDTKADSSPSVPPTENEVEKTPLEIAVEKLRTEFSEIISGLLVRINKLEKETGLNNRGVIPSTVRNENTDPGPWPKGSRPVDPNERFGG